MGYNIEYTSSGSSDVIYTTDLRKIDNEELIKEVITRLRRRKNKPSKDLLQMIYEAVDAKRSKGWK